MWPLSRSLWEPDQFENLTNIIVVWLKAQPSTSQGRLSPIASEAFPPLSLSLTQPKIHND